MVMTKESVIRLHKEMNNIGKSLNYWYIGKHIKIVAKMPHWVLQYYYIPYTYEETQKRMQNTIIIFAKYLKLMKIIDDIFGLDKK